MIEKLWNLHTSYRFYKVKTRKPCLNQIRIWAGGLILQGSRPTSNLYRPVSQNGRVLPTKGRRSPVHGYGPLGFKHNSFDDFYALISSSYLLKDKILVVLKNVCDLMCPNGLFFSGIYSGFDFAGTWEEDSCTPKLFFHPDDNLKKILADWFEIPYFKRIEFEKSELSFQSAILRKRTGE